MFKPITLFVLISFYINGAVFGQSNKSSSPKPLSQKTVRQATQPSAKPSDKQAAKPSDKQAVKPTAPTETTITKQRIDTFLKRFKQTHPERAKALEQLRKTNPEQFRLKIQELMRPQQSKTAKPSADQKTGSQWRQLIQEKHALLLQWMQKHYPTQAKELKTLRDKDPEQYLTKVGFALRRYEPIMKMEKLNPELAKVMKQDISTQFKRNELVKKIDSANKQERKKLEKSLHKLVQQRFDLIIQKKQLQYDALTKRLEKIKKDLETREVELDKLKQNKDKAVQERTNELMGRTNKMKWD